MVVYGGAGGRRAPWSGGAPHAGLAVAAAEGGEGGVREREMWPGPKGIRAVARDFDPASSLPLF